MFEVRIPGSGLKYKVYFVKEEDDVIYFLLYHYRDKWYWNIASKFEPIS